MAKRRRGIPVPLLLVLASVLESLVVVKVVPPEYLPEKAPLNFVLLCIGSINAVCFAIYKIWIYPIFLSPLRNLPGPRDGYPILHNGLSIFRKPPGVDFLKWTREIPNDGIIHFRGFFNQPRLLITDPKALGELLVTKSYDFEKPMPLRSFLRQILGDGLIIVEGDVHKFQRKHIMPAFSFRHIKNLYPIFWRKARDMTDGITAVLPDRPAPSEKGTAGYVEVNHWSNKVTMDIIGVAALGRELNALKNSDDELIQSYEEVLEPTSEKLTFFAMNLMAPQKIVQNLKFWGVVERWRILTTRLKGICQELVRNKRELIKAAGDEHFDILSLLIKSDDFGDDNLVDQMLTFLAAGHETTSSAFTWVCYLLARHPDIQTKLREEIKANLPDPTEEGLGPDTDLAGTLESMPLLNGVCQETLRLYPTVPITIRFAKRETSLVGQPIPRETQIMLCPWATNRSPHLWGENADEFVPDRWIDTETGKPNNTGGAPSNYAILTFLHGPRSCIGQGFARAELRALVAVFVGRFIIEMQDPNEDVIPAGVITTKPRNGMNLKLRRLEEW